VDELGLAEALRQMAVNDDQGPLIEVAVPDAFPPLPAAVEVAAYRIATESITNAIRHSGGRHCTVEAATDQGWLVVEISDDGTGFEVGTTPGLGLQSMVERAAEVGGELRVDSRPGHGTRVRARLPLEVS
jgi:signal transduction histidine kinase